MATHDEHRQSDDAARQEAYRQAQACEAAGDHDGAIERLKPWADTVHGPGSAGLQQLLIVSLRRLNRHDEAEAALARYAGAHPYYPMEAVVTGAIAWSEGDWMAVLLAYVDALNKELQLVDLWPRLELAATRLAEQGRLGDLKQQQLQGLIERLVEMDLPDEGLATLARVVGMVPVDTEWQEARATALVRARVVKAP